MAYFTCSNLLIHSIVLLGTMGLYNPRTIYVNDFCGKIYPVGIAVRIKLSSSDFLDPNTTCTVTLISPHSTKPLFKLVAKFLTYKMIPAYVHEDGNCDYQSIQLYRSTLEVLLPGKKGYCHFLRPIARFELGNTGHFSYTTYRNFRVPAATVDLAVIEVMDKRLTDKFHCPPDYYDCDFNNYCISNDIVCNGYDDCGNGKDEINGCELPLPVTAAVVVGFIIFIILLFVLCFFVIKKVVKQM